MPDTTLRRLLAFVVVPAALAAAAATAVDWRLLVPLALGLPVTAAIVLDDAAVGVHRPLPSLRRPGGRYDLTDAEVRALPVHRLPYLAGIWAGLFLFTTMKLLGGGRDVEAAASGQLSADIIFELALTTAAAVTLWSAARHRLVLRVPMLAWAFSGYALMATASVLWSRIPLLSAGRAYELLVIAGFVVYCAGRAANEHGFADDLFVRFLRYISFSLVGLVAFGIADGFMSWDRFGWRGTHANGAAAMLLTALLGLLLHPRRAEIARPVPWWAMAGFFTAFTYFTGSRANVAAAAVGFVAGFVVLAMRDSRIGAVGFGVWLIGVTTVWTVAAEELVEYVLRDQSSEAVTGLNGRMELWEWVLNNPLGNEIYGIGIGAARGVLPVSWNPTNVHSSWIDILQTTGVLGASIMGAAFLAILAIAIRRRNMQVAWVMGFVTVASLNSVVISLPAYGHVLVCLSIVLLAGDRAPRSEGEVAEGQAGRSVGQRGRPSSSLATSGRGLTG